MFFLGIEKNIKVEFCYSADLYATQTCIFPLFFNFLTLKMKEKKRDGNKRLPATGYLLELFAKRDRLQISLLISNLNKVISFYSL